MRDEFQRMALEAHKDYSLHDIDKSITDTDIKTYLTVELNKIGKNIKAPATWPEKT